MEPSEWKLENKTIESMPNAPSEAVFAYPVRYGGTIPDETKFTSSAEDSNGMKAFGFDHS
jgi:hypothetical protein